MNKALQHSPGRPYGSRYLRQYFATILLAFLVVFTSVPAFAQCLPGVPCFTFKTLVDPQTREIETNQGDNAPKSNRDSCNADFMNQIYARAYLEAQRENMINQTIIRKPDSVMEYTCFGQMVTKVAKGVDPLRSVDDIFSASDWWRGESVSIDGNMHGIPVPSVSLDVWLEKEQLDGHMNRMVMEALKSYVDTQFWHDYLGGSAIGIDSGTQGQIGSGPYICAWMNAVYMISKCNQFLIEDQFLSFEQMLLLDSRIHPFDMMCNNTGVTLENLSVAANFQNLHVDTNRFSDIIGGDLYLDELSGTGACSSPIPTGVMVDPVRIFIDALGRVTKIPEPEYETKICPNPGCYYDGSRCIR